MSRIRTVALIGCGNLGRMIAGYILEGRAGPYRIVGVMDAAPEAARALAETLGCPACSALDELLGLGPDYVLEATCPQAAKGYALQTLGAGFSMIMLSVGTLADGDFHRKAAEIAEEKDVKLYIPSGAVGGFDLMGAAMAGGEVSASITTRKPPKGLREAVERQGGTLPDDQVTEVFSGNAKDAIALFPQNVNVAVATGAATVGVENLPVRIISDPNQTRNRHTIELEGAFGSARIEIEAKPSPDCPRSSALAGMSVVALLRKLASPVVL